MLPPNTSEFDHCCKALSALDHVLAEKPERYHDEVIEAVRCLVRLRDRLIEQRRERGPARGLDDKLEHVNAVLSVMTAGSFPMVGLRHDRLKSARDLLVEMMENAPQA